MMQTFMKFLETAGNSLKIMSNQAKPLVTLCAKVHQLPDAKNFYGPDHIKDFEPIISILEELGNSVKADIIRALVERSQVGPNPMLAYAMNSGMRGFIYLGSFDNRNYSAPTMFGIPDFTMEFPARIIDKDAKEGVKYRAKFILRRTQEIFESQMSMEQYFTGKPILLERINPLSVEVMDRNLSTNLSKEFNRELGLRMGKELLNVVGDNYTVLKKPNGRYLIDDDYEHYESVLMNYDQLVGSESI